MGSLPGQRGGVYCENPVCFVNGRVQVAIVGGIHSFSNVVIIFYDKKRYKTCDK